MALLGMMKRKQRLVHSSTPSAGGRLLLLCVAIFALVSAASAEWKEKVLYSFQGIPDGAVPIGAVVFDKHGNLYGVTQSGGSSSCRSILQCGTVYKLARPAKQGDPWTETVLYVFKGNGSNDGASPYGGLVIDDAGNLYGTTGYGGTGDCEVLGSKLGCGTVFELSPPKEKGGAWTESVLYSFPNAKQGLNPSGDLVFDRAGNLYGATYFGGGKGTTCDPDYQYCGTVFRLSPPKKEGGTWTEKLLYSFKGVAAGAQFGDGASPNGGLVLDSNDALYGTTYFGGNNQKGRCEGGVGGTGCGVVFKLVPPSQAGGKWTEALLHRFNLQDGDNPAAGVVFDRNGNLYGTTTGGPQDGGGVIFEMKKASGGETRSWTEDVLYRFSTRSQSGYEPEAALIFDASGNLYGTTYVGNTGTLRGSVFRVKPPGGKIDTWTLSTLHGFTGTPDGENPTTALIFDKVGNLYSTTQYGGTGSGCGFTGCGAVFEVMP
jgi:hypothetical protein